MSPKTHSDPRHQEDVELDVHSLRLGPGSARKQPRDRELPHLPSLSFLICKSKESDVWDLTWLVLLHS